MAGKQYTRTIDGLIDACFDQLQDMRDGISNAIETAAFAKTADVIVRGVEAGIRRKALEYYHQQRMLELENRKRELAIESREADEGLAPYDDGIDADASYGEGQGDHSPYAEAHKVLGEVRSLRRPY